MNRETGVWDYRERKTKSERGHREGGRKEEEQKKQRNERWGM
jgi:hypothetical protein